MMIFSTQTPFLNEKLSFDDFLTVQGLSGSDQEVTPKVICFDISFDSKK